MAAGARTVLRGAVPHGPEDPVLRRAAETFVAVMLDHANARRAGGALPDLEGAALTVALAVSHAPA